MSSNTDLNCADFRNLYTRGSQQYTECRTLERAAKAGTAAAAWKTVAADLEQAKIDIATNQAANKALSDKLAAYQTVEASKSLAAQVTELENKTGNMLTGDEVAALRTLNGDFTGAVATAVAPILSSFEQNLLAKMPEGLKAADVQRWIADSKAAVEKQITDLGVPALQKLVNTSFDKIEVIEDSLTCAADTLGETCALPLS